MNSFAVCILNRKRKPVFQLFSATDRVKSLKSRLLLFTLPKNFVKPSFWGWKCLRFEKQIKLKDAVKVRSPSILKVSEFHVENADISLNFLQGGP